MDAESTLVRVDLNDAFADRIGEAGGLRPDEWEESLRAHAGVPDEVRSEGPGFLGLPHDREALEAVLRAAAGARGRFDDVVVVGIGGSALGALALRTALCHPYHDLLPSPRRRGCRLHVADNVDPARLAGLLEVLDPARTLFNVVTKSGSTAETVANYLVIRAHLEHRLGAAARAHLLFTTDPRLGDLRALAEAEGIASLPVPPGVGGRFSVLSAVGLFPAALAGVDVAAVLDGARACDGTLRDSAPGRDPALALALALHLLDVRRGRRIHVLMPYSEALRDVADWFRQLWAESLGKRLDVDGREVFRGPTPVRALGTTDQHSQVQLYVEGPPDKAVVFVAVDRHPGDRRIPALHADRASMACLAGRGLAELLEAERRGTRAALAAAGRPSLALHLPEVAPRPVGALLYLLECATAYAGRLYRVDPYDQPGVEAGKRAAHALMGRAGLEALRAELAAHDAARDPRRVY
ncbi:MAG: glucose-6-phosphate isomerase [Planctomycetes bacterium]|nr:glucose-6-phosphate isomerase [Planctomycetota bacterium]